MKSYRDRTGSEVTLNDDGKPEPPPQPCMVCRGSTPHATLNNYGMRCFRCFEAYCEEARRPPSFGGFGFRDTPTQARMRDVRRKLIQREEA